MPWYITYPDWNTKRKDFPIGTAGQRSRLVNRTSISGLHPTASEGHDPEQRSAIALKLIIGYLNGRPTNTVVKYSTEGGGRFSNRYQRGTIVEKIQRRYCQDLCILDL